MAAAPVARPRRSESRDDRTITHLFTDLGGVLLTNGWDRGLRKLVASQFGIDPAEMDERHHLTYDTYEAGKISLSDYLRAGRLLGTAELHRASRWWISCWSRPAASPR